MWMQWRAAAAVTAFLAGAGLAHAQGYTTQNPGTMTPSYASPQGLGPSGATSAPGSNRALGTGNSPGNNWSGANPSSGSNPTGTMGYGSSTGSNYGTPAGTTGMGGTTGAAGPSPTNPVKRDRSRQLVGST